MTSSNTTSVGWQAEGGGRGTWTIIWSCLTTTLIAVWVAYHGPAPWDNSFYERKSWPWKMMSVELFLKVAMTLFVILIPEGYIFTAAWDLVETKHLRDRIRRLHQEFSLRETFFICMGGYRVILPKKYQNPNDSLRDSATLTPEQILWLINKDILGFSGEKEYRQEPQDDTTPTATSQTPSTSLSAVRADADQSSNPAITSGRDSLPTPVPASALAITPATITPPSTAPKPVAQVQITPKADEPSRKYPKKQVFLIDGKTIEGRAKSSSFAKFIVVFQAFWFIVNCIVRGAHQLPLALPEVLTLSYIVCSFIAYLFWWYKPQDVGECQTFDLQLSASQWAELAKLSGAAYWRNSTMGLEYSTERWISGPPAHSIYWGIIWASWLSGGMHFIAWNAEFPTTAEQTAWRVGAVILMCMTPLMICDSRLITFREKHILSYKARLRAANSAVLMGAAAKVMVLILALLSLRSAPEGIYETYEIANYLLLSL